MTSVQTPRGKNNGVSCTPKRLYRRSQVMPPETPECFSAVTLETPNQKRRISKDKLCELSNLTVAVRIRPMNSYELSCANVYEAVSVQNSEVVVRIASPGNTQIGMNHIFQYDHVFSKNDNQDVVFEKIAIPMLESAFKGYNSCLFAYGQTGSGKSYSMMGENIETNFDNLENNGITPRFCHDLFQRISALPETSIASIEVSYFEIYNEKIHDLLSNSTERPALKVREHPNWGPYVVNLTSHSVKTYAELYNWLRVGNKNRATAATFMNDKSSRSHSIFTIEFSISELNNENGDSGRRSKISLVDLAGSERLNSHNVNEEHHRQSVSINRSLLTLGKVIAALADQKKNAFVPYRDSILTWLLRESLGGNSLTSMLATITPASSYVDETLATLRYACQARSIINRAHINEDPHDRLIRELRAEVERLRALRLDYEQKNTSATNSFNDDSYLQERDQLKNRLAEMEENLERAQVEWEKKFLKAKEKQMAQLREAELKKAQLESHLRVMTNLDTDISLSPYRSNFLDQLENLLEDEKENAQNVIAETKMWLSNVNIKKVEINLIKNKVLVKDLTTCMVAETTLDYLKNRSRFNNCPGNFLNCLEWRQDSEKSNKDIASHLNRIKDSIVEIKPLLDHDEQVLYSYNQMKKALDDFQNVLKKRKFQKSVKFQL